MTKALVTGAAGFMGSHVVDNLLKLGVDVIAVDDLSGGRRQNLSKGATWGMGSVTDDAYMEMLFRVYKFDHVYHLGAYAAEGLSHFIRKYNYTVNLLASVDLINLSVLHNVKRFVFTSSIAVYGAARPPFDEWTVPQPEDPYGISKYAVELDLKAAHKQFGLDYTIFRPHNVYGPRQNIADKYRNVVGIFMKQAMEGKPMTMFGDGKQTRAFSYIDDVAEPIALAPYIKNAKNQTFNVGSDTPRTVEDVAILVSKEFGIDTDIQYLPARNEVQHAYSSQEKLRTAYGNYYCEVSLEEGTAKMAEWVKENGIPSPTTFPGKIEVPVNMPPSWSDGVQVLN